MRASGEFAAGEDGRWAGAGGGQRERECVFWGALSLSVERGERVGGSRVAQLRALGGVTAAGSWATPPSPSSYGPLRLHLPSLPPVSSLCLFVRQNLFFELICKNFTSNTGRIYQKPRRLG